jgi:flagellar hook-associated protein 2
VAQGLYLSGIASGMDTVALTEAILMTYKAPITAQKVRRADFTATKSAYDKLETSLKTLGTAAGKARGLNAPLPLKTTTSANVTATTAETGASGSLAFTVDAIARSQSTSSDTSYASATADTSGETFTLDTGAGPVDVTGATLDEVATNINALKSGVTARVVEVAAGQYKLQVVGDKPGTDAAFTLASDAGTFTTNRAASNAQVTVDGLTLTRQSNTFDNLIAGTSVVVGTVGDATLTVETDTSKAVENVKSIVDAFNEVLATVSKQAASGGQNLKAGPLSGESTVRRIAMALRNAIAEGMDPGDGTTATFSELGINLTRTGTVEFSATELREKLAADPARAQAFTQGLAEKLKVIVDDNAKTGGAISVVTDSLEVAITRADKRIVELERIQDERRVKLRMKFATLEASTAALQAMGSQALSQLNSLPMPYSGR